jgi:hypothetical protein
MAAIPGSSHMSSPPPTFQGAYGSVPGVLKKAMMLRRRSPGPPIATTAAHRNGALTARAGMQPVGGWAKPAIPLNGL